MLIDFRDVDLFTKLPSEVYDYNCEHGIGPRALMWLCPSLSIEEAEEIFRRGSYHVPTTFAAMNLSLN